MSSMATVAEQLPGRPPAASAPSISWAAFAWFSALLITAYFAVLKHLVEQWSNDENVSHGFFVPAVALYIAWQRRDSVLAIERKPAWWGLAIMAWGALQGYVGVLGAEAVDFLERRQVEIEDVLNRGMTIGPAPGGGDLDHGRLKRRRQVAHSGR